MTFLNAVLDLDDQTRLQTFQEIVDVLGDFRPGADTPIDLFDFAPLLSDDGRALPHRTPLR